MKTNTLAPARLLRALALVAGVAAVLAALPATSPQAEAAACSARYIAVKQVMAQGTKLYALYHTAAPVKAWLTLYEPGTKTILTTGYRMTWHMGTPESPAVLSPPIQLKPDTQYEYVLTAEDAGGCRYYARGSARTLKRMVEVTFEKIVVADDGDSFGAGELMFDFLVNGTPDLAAVPSRSVTAPATVLPRLTMKVVGVPETFKVHTRVIDNDWTGPFDNCPPTGWGNGSNKCWDWATALTTITAPANGAIGRGRFSSYAKGGTAFQVVGSWRVSYVP